MHFRTIMFGLVLVAAVAAIWLLYCADHAEAPLVVPDTESLSSRPLPPDTDNFTFSLDGKLVTLENGLFIETVGPDAHVQTRVEYFGNEAFGDLNGDNVLDTALLVTVDGGGSGTFFYVVAIVSTSDGFRGTNALLLGDRIAPQTTDIVGDTVVVNFADRAPGTPMASEPSIGQTKQYRLNGVTLVPVE